jgi:hypothetical protein
MNWKRRIALLILSLVPVPSVALAAKQALVSEDSQTVKRNDPPDGAPRSVSQ